MVVLLGPGATHCGRVHPGDGARHGFSTSPPEIFLTGKFRGCSVPSDAARPARPGPERRRFIVGGTLLEPWGAHDLRHPVHDPERLDRWYRWSLAVLLALS